MAEPVCDFCLAPNPEWEFPADPTLVPAARVDLSPDEWAACGECRELIDEGDVDALVVRIVDKQPVHVPEGTRREGGWVHYGSASSRRRAARENVASFMRARSGPSRPYRG